MKRTEEASDTPATAGHEPTQPSMRPVLSASGGPRRVRGPANARTGHHSLIQIAALRNTHNYERWLSGTDSGAEGMQGVAHGDGGVAGDLPLRLVLVVGLQELRVLLLDLLGVLARRAEQQWLQVVVQVLACLRGHLPIGDPRFQVPHDRGGRRGDRGQGAGVPGRWALAGRFVRLMRSWLSRG
jgi:hypothetical protein